MRVREMFVYEGAAGRGGLGARVGRRCECSFFRFYEINYVICFQVELLDI